MIRRPPRSTLSSSSAASDVYKRQVGVLVELALIAARDQRHRAGDRPQRLGKGVRRGVGELLEVVVGALQVAVELLEFGGTTPQLLLGRLLRADIGVDRHDGLETAVAAE